MSLTTWLDGKVTRQKLASLIPPVPPDAPRVKRLMLPQGELAQFHDGEEGMRYVASVELKPGTVRFARFDGGPLETQKASRAAWAAKFSPQDFDVLTNLYGKHGDRMVDLLQQARINFSFL